MAAKLKTIAERLADAEEIIRRKNTELVTASKELKRLRKDQDDLADACRRIWEIKDLEPSPPTWLMQEPVSKHIPGVPMTNWSDWHYGERVFGPQVGHVNEFNMSIANQRIRRLVDITIDLTYHHMVRPKYPGIVVCLGGDFISGNLHMELAETNEVPVMVSLVKVQEQLIAAITAVADKFGKVFIPCVVGNHGRTTIKPRAKNRVYDSFEWHLYQALRAYFKDDPRVHFYIPDEADAAFTVLGHRFHLTHGDALGVRGGDGIIGALGPIARGAVKVGRSEAQIGRDFDTLIIGHWHIYIPRGDAVPVAGNGSLKGYDEFARLFLRAPYARPSQSLWFMHAKHGFTAQWPIYLDNKKQATDATEWVSWPVQKA
jgi:predicted phosphodiesterase